MLPPPTVASPDDRLSDKSDFDPNFEHTRIASNVTQVGPSSSPTKDEEDTSKFSTAPRPPRTSGLKTNRRQPLGLIETLSSRHTDTFSHITSLEHTDGTHFSKSNYIRIYTDDFRVTQIKDVTSFENFAPDTYYVTIRKLFALTALPIFTVPSYDVSVTFIERILDERRCLYDMRDSQLDYTKLFESICQSFHFTQLMCLRCY